MLQVCALIFHRWSPWLRTGHMSGLGYFPNALTRECKRCGKVEVR